MYALVDMTNGRSFGTFKFQYSKYYPINRDNFIPSDDKRLAELMLGSFLSESLKRHYKRNVFSTKACVDDSNKNPDILISEEGVWKGVQITRLLFTQYEWRKNISEKMNKFFADSIASFVSVDIPVIVNIYPTTQKGIVPLQDVSKGKEKIYLNLCRYVADNIKSKKVELANKKSPIWITIGDSKLSEHFKFIALNPIPNDAFPRFARNGNIFVNYDQDDVAFNSVDMDTAIDEVYRKKNSGISEILLIWADDFDLATQKNVIAERIWLKFQNTTFVEVFFMTFENHISRFINTLQLWPIKTIPCA